MTGKLVLLACLAFVQARADLNTRSDVQWEAHPRCVNTLFPHWLIPHETDCTLFYYCENGMRRLPPSRCAVDTEFAYHIQTCTHPFSANCNLGGGDGPGSGGGSLPNGCPTGSNWTHHLLPHESDCGKFYYCGEHGALIESDCPPGLHFDSVLQVCTFPSEANCKLPGVSPTET